METTPSVGNAVPHTVIDIRSGEGSTVRFYDSAEEEPVALEYGPAAVTVQATRPYTDGETDGLL